MTSIFRCVIFLCFLILQGCYSFKGISIPNDINTYYVEDFNVSAPNVPADLNQIFAEALRKKVREESKLVYNDSEPDVIFEGTITKYANFAVAPEEGNTTSLNRLEISVSITYVNEINTDDTWTKRYTDFEDYDSTIDLQSIETELIETIVEDIMERIFNDAFTNW